MAPFVLWDYLSIYEKEVWLSLSKVFKEAYSIEYHPNRHKDITATCTSLVEAITRYKPELLNKPKFHLLLHLSENMADFGPTSAYNTERCESFNGIMREHNLHGNHQACSRDIAERFALMEHLNYLSNHGGSPRDSDFRCGVALAHLLTSYEVRSYTTGIPAKVLLKDKEIYQHGVLRKSTNRRVRLGELEVYAYNNKDHLSVLQREGFTIQSSIYKDTLVSEYSATTSIDGEIVNIGDNVVFKTTDEDSEAKYGRLASCFQLNGNRYSIIQPYGKVEGRSEQDCPKLQLFDILKVTASQAIQKSVSIVHDCILSCKLVNTSTHTIERETVHRRGKYMSVVHNVTHNIFCLNIYNLASQHV